MNIIDNDDDNEDNDQIIDINNISMITTYNLIAKQHFT